MSKYKKVNITKIKKSSLRKSCPDSSKTCAENIEKKWPHSSGAEQIYSLIHNKRDKSRMLKARSIFPLFRSVNRFAPLSIDLCLGRGNCFSMFSAQVLDESGQDSTCFVPLAAAPVAGSLSSSLHQP